VRGTGNSDRQGVEARDHAAPARAFSRYRRAGPLVFVSSAGIEPGAARQWREGPPGIREQTAACIEEMRRILEEAGGGLENLVDVTSYLVTMNDFGGYNDIYSKFFSPDGPARTTVAVQQLSHPDSLIEIRGTAYIIESVGAPARTTTEDYQR
jgi:2-aminomuconate deaminase